MKVPDPHVFILDLSEAFEELWIDVNEVVDTLSLDDYGHDDYFAEFGSAIEIVCEAMAGAFKDDFPVREYTKNSMFLSKEEFEKPFDKKRSVEEFESFKEAKKMNTPRYMFYERVVEAINKCKAEHADVSKMRPEYLDLYHNILVITFSNGPSEAQ